jgi:hypothetical protein
MQYKLLLSCGVLVSFFFLGGGGGGGGGPSKKTKILNTSF